MQTFEVFKHCPECSALCKGDSRHPTVAMHHSQICLKTVEVHLDNAVRELEAQLDADRLQVPFAPLLHPVLAHVCYHCDQNVERVQLVTAQPT